MNQVAPALLAILAISLGGCGTVCNFAAPLVDSDKEVQVYGGFQTDIEVLQEMNSKVRDGGTSRGEAIVTLTVAAGDPVLCLVADTLTLPVTLAIQQQRADEERRDREQSSLNPDPGREPDNAGEPVALPRLVAR